MKALWLSFHDPLPAINGQYLYSAGLIASVGAAGTALDVVALTRGDGRHFNGQREDNVTWHLASGGEWQSAVRMLSPLPKLTLRCATPNMRALTASLLEKNTYDVIVFDSLCAGWALDFEPVTESGAPLVHIAHNRERIVAERIAEHEERGLRKLVLREEARKIGVLEQRLIAACQLTTSNTPEDLATFQAENPGKVVMLLPPGYSGRRVHARQIDADAPRRVVIVGSFNWEPKRTSLEAFLKIATPLFSTSGIELQVVGSADQPYLDFLRSTFPSVVFTGRVPDVYDRLAKARIAVIPDYLGGFKLKSLDYVFNRVPIFALEGSVPGVPLEDGASLRLFANHASLAAGVVDHIDAFDTLNALQEAAYRAFAPLFDWGRIGRGFVESIERECGLAPGSGTSVRSASLKAAVAAS